MKTKTLLLAGLLALHIPLSAEPASTKETVTDFTVVAKEAIPAVVSIRVKANAHPASNLWGGLDDESTQDLFKFFFGNPRGRQLEQEPVYGQGSGFLISEDGYILTNSHVVKDMSEIVVITNERDEYPAKVIGADSNSDVALIKIDARNMPFLKLGNSDNLEVGQWVIAIGNPMGLQASLTVGVVSAKGRNDLDLVRIEDFIQTDAAINRGNSGGPLLNLSGQVVGMNTAIATNTANGYMGIGFSIPSNIITHIKEELLATGSAQRGFLGVILQPIDKDLATAFGLEKADGVLVADVQKGGPAELAGIKTGDIITKMNGTVFKTSGALRTAISLMAPGSAITLTVLRDKKPVDLRITVGSFPDDQKLAAAAAVTNKLGFAVEAVSQEISDSLGLPASVGVLVSKVEPGSLASLAGIKKGAVILNVNQKKITSVAEFNQELQNTPEGQPVLFLIKQGATTRFVSLKL